MWMEKTIISSKTYEKTTCLTTPYQVTKIARVDMYARPKINGIPKFSELKWTYTRWKVEKDFAPKFGISPAGITIKMDEIKVNLEKLKPKIFYLFSYKDEKYVARKVDRDIVEIYEVLE